MVVDADAIHEERQIEVTHLVRRINPAQQEQHHTHQRQHDCWKSHCNDRRIREFMEFSKQ